MTRRHKVLAPWCHYCFSAATTWDHVVPKALGGKDGLYNLVPSCAPCNTAKADSFPTCPCWRCQEAIVRHFVNNGLVREEEQASWAS